MTRTVVQFCNDDTPNFLIKQYELLKLNFDSLRNRNKELETVVFQLQETIEQMNTVLEKQRHVAYETQKRAGSIVGLNNFRRNQ